MGISCIAYPVYAQEETEIGQQTETENGIQLYTENNAGSFHVSGGTSGDEWTYDSTANTLTFHTGGTYTVTGNGTQTSESIIVSDNFEGTITIENINISAECAFEVKNTANLTLKLSGENTFYSTDSRRAGLEFADAVTGSLVITSDNGGSLNSTGGVYGAGIGGGYGRAGNNITISGGDVTATSGNGAGIGGGYGRAGNNITISGGDVTATSDHGAGIGGSDRSAGNNITISDGTVIATSDSGAGIGGGRNGAGNNITISGGAITATSDSGAGIGGGIVGSGSDITISGGTVTATSNYGAGIGGGFEGAGSNITISGGTITATSSDSGAGIGGGFEGAGSNITISGGTVTVTSDHGAGIGGGLWGEGSSNITISNGSVKAPSVSVIPTDGNSNNVYLAKIEGISGIDAVTVDETQTFSRDGDHPDDGAFYLYLTGQDHTIITDEKTYIAEWNTTSSSFAIKQTIPVPTISIQSKTATSITVQPLADTNIFGEAEYSIDNQDWQSSNVFTGLTADTQYTVYARYKGNDTYIQSEPGSVSVTTMKDGNAFFQSQKPTDLKGVYEQKLADISLPDDWTWVSGDTALSVGEQNYSARFDTTGYEAEYDFTGVEGYSAENHYVETGLAVNVSKVDTILAITTDNMDKSYDGHAVSNPDVEKTGSANTVTFTWYEKNGNSWKKIDQAPVNAGSYKIAAAVQADDNYNGAAAEKEFSISRSDNEWTEELSIENWVYGEEANAPTAAAKYGEVVFTYSDSENGIFEATVPATAGLWYVKATVAGNASYTGMEAVQQFEIFKADSTIAFANDFTLDKGYDGKVVEISGSAVTKTGSENAITFTWYQKNENQRNTDDSWTELTAAPADAGSYKVTASVAEDANYKGAAAYLEFAISQTVNEWTADLSLSDWTYGETAGTPTAAAKYGEVIFTYSDSENGIFEATVPATAGTWYVKAAVAGNDSYTGLEAVQAFEIRKAVPAYTVPTGLTIRQGQTLSSVVLPNGFTWVDAAQTVDAWGVQTFKALFTPTDVENYQTVEVDITVNVSPAQAAAGQAPAASGNTGKGTADSAQAAVMTGDSGNIIGWTVLVAVSALSVGLSVLFRRRKRNL